MSFISFSQILQNTDYLQNDLLRFLLYFVPKNVIQKTYEKDCLNWRAFSELSVNELLSSFF